jgi:hypothetical protein
MSFDQGYLFVELGQTRSDDTLVHNKSTDVEVSNAIPLVKHTASVSTVEQFNVPLVITPEIQLCLAFYDAFSANAFNGANGHKGVVKVQIDPAKDKAALNKQVESMFKAVLSSKDIRVPPLKMYWNMFFKVFADRCNWLQYYSRCILQDHSSYFLKFL